MTFLLRLLLVPLAALFILVARWAEEYQVAAQKLGWPPASPVRPAAAQACVADRLLLPFVIMPAGLSCPAPLSAAVTWPSSGLHQPNATWPAQPDASSPAY